MRRMPPLPLILPKVRQRRRKKGSLFQAPRRSSRVYLYIDPSKVHLFRYFLEAEDNLGLMTVVDRWRAALLVRFSPHQEHRLLEVLEEIRESLPFEGPFKITDKAFERALPSGTLPVRAVLR